METPIFVVGSGRCGTSLLSRLIVDNLSVSKVNFEPQIFACPQVRRGLFSVLNEGSLDKKNYDYIGGRYKFSTSRSGIRGFYRYMRERELKVLLNKLEKDSSPYGVRKFVDGIYSRITHGERWLDSGPMNGRIIPHILNVYPQAKFIHVIRNGLDVAASFRKLGWVGGDFCSAFQFWTFQVMATRSFGQLYPENYIEISYDQFVEDPEKYFHEVCEFLDIHPAQYDLSQVKKKRTKQNYNLTPPAHQMVRALAKAASLEEFVSG